MLKETVATTNPQKYYTARRFWHVKFKQWYYTDDGLSWYADYAPAFNDYVNEQLAEENSK